MKAVRQKETFYLPFSTISSLSGEKALEKIRTAKKIQLDNLKVFDLILDNNELPSTWHGVYVYFSEKGECLYSGKNESRSFIERIPAHFALQKGAWMNQFILYLKDFKKLKNIEQAVLEARKCSLLLIPVEAPKSIVRLEKFLRVFLELKLNRYSEKYRSRYKNFNLSESLDKLLTKI